MGLLGLVGLLLIAIGLWRWLVLPQLRGLSWWERLEQSIGDRLRSLITRLWALAGNSRTIAVAYAAELLGLLDEAKLLDWSALVGSEHAGRVMAAMGIAMIGLRLVTRTAVSFHAKG
jgi:hypothetical protein